VSYLVSDPETKQAAIIGPVLDYDHKSRKTATTSADAIPEAAKKDGLKIVWLLETHTHADHLSDAPYIKIKTGAKVGIGEHIRDVQKIFRPVFNATDLSVDGNEFDHLFSDGERFPLGSLEVEVIHVPGHTPADVAYKIGDAVFVGDTLFMPDLGRPERTFLAAMPIRFIARPGVCSHCRPRPGSSSVTITKHQGGTTMPGRQRSPNSGPKTPPSMTP